MLPLLMYIALYYLPWPFHQLQLKNKSEYICGLIFQGN